MRKLIHFHNYWVYFRWLRRNHSVILDLAKQKKKRWLACELYAFFFQIEICCKHLGICSYADFINYTWVSLFFVEEYEIWYCHNLVLTITPWIKVSGVIVQKLLLWDRINGATNLLIQKSLNKILIRSFSRSQVREMYSIIVSISNARNKFLVSCLRSDRQGSKALPKHTVVQTDGD